MIDQIWVNGYPCVWVYECMAFHGFIPSDLKILLLMSSYDPVVLAYIYRYGAVWRPLID